MPLWWALLEKAYATFLGGYAAFADGGYAYELFEAVLGCRPSYLGITRCNHHVVWRRILTALKARLPVAAGTAGKSSQLRYRNVRIFPDHYYAILAYTIQHDEKWLTLRNPWGGVTPTSDTGSDKGVFALSFSKFMRYFQSVETVHDCE
jgi:hypothetical protein